MLICYTGTLLILARNWLRNPAGVLANPFSHSPARENTNFLPRRKTALHWMIKLVEDSPMGVAVSFEKQLLFPTTIVCFCLSSISGRRRFPTSETWKKKIFKAASLLGGAMAILKMFAYLLKFMGVILLLYCGSYLLFCFFYWKPQVNIKSETGQPSCGWFELGSWNHFSDILTTRKSRMYFAPSTSALLFKKYL